MASKDLPVPAPMVVKGDMRGNWKFFKSQWSNYQIATGLVKKEMPVRLATLLTVMGKDCFQIYENLPLSIQDREDIDKILEALDGHFMPKTNVIYERYIFNTADQLSNESFDDYLCRLRELAKTCEFGDIADQMIRDRIVLGTNDQSVRGRLLKESKLTLNSAVDMCRTSERTASQLKKLQGQGETHSNQAQVNYAARGGHKKHIKDVKHKQKKFTAQPPKYPKKADFRCKYCGGKHERGREKCPAYKQVCGKCNKKNHFASVCLSSNSTVLQLDDETDDSCDSSDCEACYTVKTTHGKQWFAKVNMAIDDATRQDVICQLDSGSTCNILGFRQYCILTQNGCPLLKPTAKALRLYGGKSKLEPLGTVDITCSVQNNTECLNFYIVDTDQTALLSAEACELLGLLTVNTVNSVDIPTNCKDSYEPLTRSQLLNDYKDVFEGLGSFPGEYKIETDPSVKPVQHQPRKVHQAMKQEIHTKLKDLENRGVIKKVTTPTDWISSMLIVKKPGKLRICIDPRDLNKAIKRSHYIMPTLEDILPNLANAKVFSVLDAREGFWHIKLDEHSSYLTTFWTPFGRFRWLRLPFGISSAPEEFQRRQHEVLEGLTGAECVMDDIIVYGCGQTMESAIQDHDRNLTAVLQRARDVGLKLNKDKFKLRQTEVKYMGNILTADGIRPDPDKVTAITDMRRPENVKAVQRFIGLATYLSRFMPHLSETCEPLRRLTDKGALWSWQSQQEEAFQSVKRLVSRQPVLKYYNVHEEVTIQCDASEVGLGATLLQNGQPVAYASRALSKTEQCYAQIEKECLAIVFACERFDHYIYGKDHITVQSDHKPLEIIFKKSLLSAPKRLQRMLLRLQKYNLDVVYTRGKELYIADTLSRATPEYHGKHPSKLAEEIAQIQHAEWVRKITDSRLNQIRDLTNKDDNLQSLKTVILSGWPDTKDDVPIAIRPYWNVKDTLTVQDGIIYHSSRVVIPKALRPEMLRRTHSSHLGIEASLRKARDSLYWPLMNEEIKDFVSQCSTCSTFQHKQQKEPLMTHDIPEQPWLKLGIDIFSVKTDDYLVTVDYYSDFFELDLLPDTTAATVINCLKQHFARHGTPEVVVTDNGPQFKAVEFHQFACDWEFQHVTSSPYHSQSNGKAESAVKIAKNMVKKCNKNQDDLWKSILDWRNTPTVDMASSPSQRLMSRRTRHSLPMSQELLQPKLVDDVTDKVKFKRQKAKFYYDRTTKELPELEIGQPVRMRATTDPEKKWSYGTCVDNVGKRSYLVEVNNRQYRRNRKDLRATKEPQNANTQPLPEYDVLVDPPPDMSDSSNPKDQHVKDLSPQKPSDPHSSLRTSSRDHKLPRKFADYVM